MKSSFPEIIGLLKNHQRIALTTHVNPDGDALGSEIALYAVLRQLAKDVAVLNHSATPANYLWLDPAGIIVTFVPERHKDLLLKAELIVILDTNQPDRLRSLEPFVRESRAVKLVIDHHLEPSDFGQHYLINEESTSTGELLYKLFRAMGRIEFTPEIATALYTAIMTDTGSFRFPRTDAETHRITAHLLESGADPTQIYVNVYEQWSPNRMRLLGEVLDSMKTAYDGQLAYVVCTQKMFRDTGTTEVETDNFTTYPMSIAGVVIGILFNELQNGVKISFRSKGTIPVNQLAKEVGGNGHLNAAGARLFNVSLQDAISDVTSRAKKYLAQQDVEKIPHHHQ